MSERPTQQEFANALEFRIAIEEWAKTQGCGVRGCTNRATHTWSGHPTCDDCALPGRVGLPFPILIGATETDEEGVG